jgi:hypothetical protein
MDSGTASSRPARKPSGLSYKFQRLRERIRQAIVSGELSGKLPGERQLAHRFHANAKTLSKALTDLAAEGLLDRSIGRGTYVRGAGPGPQRQGKTWLLLCDVDQVPSLVVQELLRTNPEAQAVTDMALLRPSFLAKFSAVVDFASSTPEAVLRDLMVRGIPLVSAAPRAWQYSGHTVQMDRVLGAFCATRDLLLLGHVHLGVVTTYGSDVQDAARQAAQRYAPSATIAHGAMDQVAGMLDEGVTALLCDGLFAAHRIHAVVNQRQIQVPAQVSVAVVATSGPDPAFTGYYVDDAVRAEAIVQAINEFQPHRPAAIWLTGHAVDRGTTAPPATAIAGPRPTVTPPASVAMAS